VHFNHKRQGWDICEKFATLRFATKCEAVKFVNLECRAASPNREISATIIRERDQNAPEKIDEANPGDYIYGKATYEGDQGIKWRNCISDLAWVRLGVDPAKPSKGC